MANLIKTIDTRVAGITFYNEGLDGEYRQSIVHDMKVRGQLEVGQRLRLQPEPTNKYDQNAVAIIAPDGRQLGYVPRAFSQEMTEYIKNGKTVLATITKVEGGSGGIGYKLSLRLDCYETDLDDAEDTTSERTDDTKVFVTGIIVRNMFGMFSYTLDIFNDLTLLHAMNGGGKTTILRLLNAIINDSFTSIGYVPLDEYTVKFSNGARITLKGNNQEESYSICFKFPKKHIAPSDTNYKVGDTIPVNDPQVKSLIKFCTGSLHVKLVAANRLYDLSAEDLNGQERVIVCADKIQSSVHNAKDVFTQISETLDSSFLYRVMEDIIDHKECFTWEDCNRRNAALEEQRDRYAQYGLVNSRERHSNSTVSFDVNATTSTDTLHMITTYVRDGETKNKMITDVYDRIGLLLDMINNEHAFCMKKLIIDFSKPNPVYFETANALHVPLEKLSSGEKNDFILFTELVFDTNASTLVLIDEPEISLHPAWQLLIVDELMKIGNLNNFQTIVATHSPNIVNDHWDRTVGLEV